MEVNQTVEILSNRINLFIDKKHVKKNCECIFEVEHLPSGMLKFWIYPNTPYRKYFLIKILVICLMVPQICI